MLRVYAYFLVLTLKGAKRYLRSYYIVIINSFCLSRAFDLNDTSSIIHTLGLTSSTLIATPIFFYIIIFITGGTIPEGQDMLPLAQSYFVIAGIVYGNALLVWLTNLIFPRRDLSIKSCIHLFHLIILAAWPSLIILLISLSYTAAIQTFSFGRETPLTGYIVSLMSFFYIVFIFTENQRQLLRFNYLKYMIFELLKFGLMYFLLKTVSFFLGVTKNLYETFLPTLQIIYQHIEFIFPFI